MLATPPIAPPKRRVSAADIPAVETANSLCRDGDSKMSLAAPRSAHVHAHTLSRSATARGGVRETLLTARPLPLLLSLPPLRHVTPGKAPPGVRSGRPRALETVEVDKMGGAAARHEEFAPSSGASYTASSSVCSLFLRLDFFPRLRWLCLFVPVD